MKRKIIWLGLGVLVFLVALPGFFLPLVDGWLRRTLLSAASDSASIKVIEHSDRYDFAFLGQNDYKEKIYRTVTLSADDISRLRKALPLSRGAILADACLFSSHHRIEFLRRDGKVTILEICFHCGDIELDGRGGGKMPVGWRRSLESFIVSLGMSPIPKKANMLQSNSI